MNINEFEMIDVLKRLKNEYGVFELKAEFEAEGSRMEEMMRLRDIANRADLPIILKIGGAEAVTDIYNGIILGVEGLIAPMVETPYAVYKYLGVIENLINPDNRDYINFAINIETKTAVENIDEILKLEKISLLRSITFGRSDFAQSCGLAKKNVDNEKILNAVQRVSRAVKAKGLKFAIGGNITAKSIDFIKTLKAENLIDKYETRKVVFAIDSINANPREGINTALKFELLWLKSKRRFYARIKAEDEQRIEDLEKRLSNR